MTNEENKKTLEGTQEEIKKVENKFGDFTDNRQMAAPLPEVNQSLPLDDLSPSQTQSQTLLHFTVTNPEKSNYKKHYHPVTGAELRKLNRYASQLQQVSKWYLENLADSRVHYVYAENQSLSSIEITYRKENFMHLTGIAPVGENQTPEKTLEDFVMGNGEYENILISNRGATFEKLQVLPDLEAIVDASSFYFDDMSGIEKFKNIELSKAIRTEDKDLLLAFKTVDGETFPASLMKLGKNLNTLIDEKVVEHVILGVYRERNGELTQLSINEEYIHDGGKELMSIIQSQLQQSQLRFEQNPEVSLETQSTNQQIIEEVLDSMDLSEYKYFVEDEELWNQLVDQLPYDMPTEGSPISFTQSSEPDVIGYVSFNGTDEVTLEEVMEYFQEHGITRLEDQLATLQKWKEEIESLGENVSEMIQQATQSLNAPSLNLQNHWKIEYTSLEHHALIQSNHIITSDVLHALQEQDERLHQEQNRHFLYLEHYFNGVKIESLPLDLGNGIEENQEIYQRVRHTFENQTDVQETLQQLELQTQELTNLYSYEKEEIEKLVVRSHFNSSYAHRTLVERMNAIEDYIIRPLDLSKDRLSTETIEKHTKEMQVLAHLANNSEVKNRYGHSVEDLIQMMNHPTQWLLEKATSTSQTDYWQVGFIERTEMNPGVQEGEVVTAETLEAIHRLQQNNVHGSYYETTLYHFVDGEVVEQHPFRLGIMEEKEKEMIDQIKESFTPKTPQTISEIIANKDYKGLKQHLEEGIHDYLKGDTFKAYLDFVSKLPTFSFRNVQLLYRQKQDATIVMNMPKWKALGRYVNKGEKALYIYRPYHTTMKDEKGEPLLDENGKEIQKTYFKLTPVFDISQTNGKEIPRMTYDLEEDFKDPKVFIAMYKAIVGCTTATVRGEEFPPEERMRGYFRPSTNEIVIRKGLGQVMAIKTLIHEVVHSRLHKENDPTGTNRKQEEFEAEATAYIVSNHFGIDTSEYSFGYLANWTSGGKDIAQFSDSLERITNEAKVLIDTIEQAMVKIKTVELEKQPANKFEERVQLAQEKQAKEISKEAHSSLEQKVEDVRSSKK